MDAEYCICCAAEYGELTALEYLTLTHAPAAYNAVRRLVDADFALPPHFLQNTAQAFLAEAPAVERHLLALASLHHNDASLRALKGRTDFLVEEHGLHQLGLGSPITELRVELFPELAVVRRAPPLEACAITEAWCRGVLTESLSGLRARWEQTLEAQDAALRWFQSGGAEEASEYQRALGRPLFQAPACGNAQAVAAQFDEEVTLAASVVARRDQILKQRAREQRGVHKRARAAIKKATKLMASLGRTEQVRLLVSGSEIVISHPDSPFKFVLQAKAEPGWLIRRTATPGASAPLNVLLLTKEDVRIASLCVLFKDCPVTDFVLAFSMIVEAGDEVRLLEKANWYGIEGRNDELASLIVSTYPGLAEKIPRLRGEHEHISYEPMLARVDSPWQPYSGPAGHWASSWLAPITQTVETLRALAQPGELQLPAVVRQLLAVA